MMYVMKKCFVLLIFICCLCAVSLAYADSFFAVAVINDPDGYTNIRAERSNTAKVLGRINKGEYFLVTFRGPNEGWWSVWTPKIKEGFMHKSRIRIVKDAVGAADILDKDGFTNIRSGPSTAHKVIGRVNKGEVFFVLKRGKEWDTVMTRYGLEGYMHGSRVRLIIAPDCVCE